MLTGPYLCLYQISSRYFKPYTQEFGLESRSGEVTRKQPQQRLSCLHMTCLLLFMPLQNIIKIFQTTEDVIECTIIGLGNLFSGVYTKKNKARVVLLALDTPT